MLLSVWVGGIEYEICPLPEIDMHWSSTCKLCHCFLLLFLIHLLMNISFLILVSLFQRVSSQAGPVNFLFQAVKWGWRAKALESAARLHPSSTTLGTYQILPAFKKEQGELKSHLQTKCSNSALHHCNFKGLGISICLEVWLELVSTCFYGLLICNIIWQHHTVHNAGKILTVVCGRPLNGNFQYLMQIFSTTYFQQLGIFVLFTRGGVCTLFLSVMYIQNRVA